jgi:hypothetical protein
VAAPFGPYRLLSRIATGGMGEIFLAKLLKEDGFEKTLVIKRMLPHLSQNQDFIQMFQAEARIAARLSHQNVVQIFDFGKIGDSYYIAMEYVAGADLRTLFFHAQASGARLSLPHALQIASDCCAGLDYAHRLVDERGAPLGIIHRDVSPQNILVSFEGEVKITDFGLAKAKLCAIESEAGTLKGKYSYLSPEQVLGHRVDHRSDLFSLGVVLYEMCLGERLFPVEDSLTATLERVRRCQIPDLDVKAPALPPDLAAILRRALSRDPAGRFASAAEMREEIERVRMRLGETSSAQGLGGYLRGLLPPRPAGEPVEDYGETVVSGRPIVMRSSPVPEAGRARVAALPAQGVLSGTSPRRRRPLIAGLILVLLVGTGGLLYFGLEPREPVAPAATARLTLQSTPSGAAVWVDGEDQGQTTPTVLDGLDPTREVTVELRLPGYEPHRWRGLPRGDLRLEAELRPQRARLEVRSRPEGAEIFLDGVRVAGQTPRVLEDLALGSHRLRLSKPGFRDWEQEIRVDGPRPAPVLAELRPGARLRVVTTPPGATIVVDGVLRPGRSPLIIDGLAPGTLVRVMARKAGYRVAERAVRLEGAFSVLNLELKPLAVLLEITGFGDGPARQVLVDRQPEGRLPVKGRRLDFGEHTLQLLDDEKRSEVRLLLRLTRPGPHARAQDVVANLHARPWAEVRIDGRALGPVPLANQALGFGMHRLELRWAGGASETLHLRIEAETERR